MNAKQLFIPLALIGVCSVETTPASAAVISFSEDPNETAAIVVTTDIVGATIAAGRLMHEHPVRLNVVYKTGT